MGTRQTEYRHLDRADVVEDDLARLKAARGRLARELVTTEERIDELREADVETPRTPDPAPDAARLATVHRKLELAAAALQDAHRMRSSVLDRRAIERQQMVDEAVYSPPPEPARRGIRGALAAAALLVALGAGVLLGALVLGDGEPATTGSAAKAGPAATAAQVPACSSLPAGAGESSAVTCATGSGTLLTVGAGTTPVEPPGTSVRVLDLQREGTDALVRMRLRNRTRSEQSFEGRVYLSAGGRRIDPVVTEPSSPLAAGEARTLTTRFPLADSTATRGDLGVVPFAQPVDEPRHIAVVRLSLLD